MPKATFDGPNKLIIIDFGETSLDAKVDIYSDWKEWVLESDNSKYLQALRTVGGDPTTGAQFISPYYFLMNGWRIRPHEADHFLVVDGNLFVDGGGNPFITTLGAYNVVVNLTTSVNAVTEVVTASGIEASVSEQDKADIVDGVWDEQLGGHTNAGSTGKKLGDLPLDSTIADSVWDEALTDHQAVGSTGEALAQAATASGIIEASVSEQDKLDIADRVWDELLAGHTISDSAGEALATASGIQSVDIDTDSIADAVWDEQLDEHQQAGSAGEGLATASGVQDVDVDAIVDGVWDEALADHQGAGTTGEALDAAATASGISVDTESIADAVWDEQLSGHQQSGSAGEGLATASGVQSVDVAAIADGVWDETLADHQGVGTTGEALDAAATASGIQVDTESIADAVWDEAQADHTTSGSFGKVMDDHTDTILRALGLVQENYYLDNTVYTTWSGISLLTSGRLRTYSNAGSVGTGSNVLATYQITSTWTNDQLDTYKVVKS
jgi:hypothetical protein